MIHLKKRLAFGLAAGLLAACITVPVYGASRKKITSISLTIKADIEADTDYGDETIEIESSSSRYNVDGYEVMNEGFGWTEDTVPEIRIMLTANGREVRIMVVPEQISDDDMVLLAREVSKRIESELEYPGQIKVNVIRESRVTDYAK